MRTPPNERLIPDIAGIHRPRKAEPERRCVLSGQTDTRDALIRLAVSPAGLVLPDAQEKAPGRGAWITASRAAVEDGQANGRLKAGLARVYKSSDLDIPDDLPARIEDALIRVVLDRLGLELRVGTLVLGTQRIAETARTGRIALLLHASDASEDGRKKLDQAWRVGCDAEGTGQRGWILPLDRDALSVALGRDNVVHLGLANEAAAARVTRPLKRLLQYRGQDIPIDHAPA